MKHFLPIALGFVWLQVASATPVCVTGTLSTYEALGAGGCSIGADIVSSFTTLTGSTGSTAISPSTITITPTGGTTNPELTFSFSLTVNPPNLDEAIFNYLISGPAYLSDLITLSGSSESGNGDVTDTQNYCVSGHFGSNGVSGCTGSSTGSLIAVDGVFQTGSAAFSGPASLSITDDFVLDSGGGAAGSGSASGGTFADQFTAVSATPEPGAYLLTGIGLAFAILRKSGWVN